MLLSNISEVPKLSLPGLCMTSLFSIHLTEGQGRLISGAFLNTEKISNMRSNFSFLNNTNVRSPQG